MARIKTLSSGLVMSHLPYLKSLSLGLPKTKPKGFPVKVCLNSVLNKHLAHKQTPQPGPWSLQHSTAHIEQSQEGRQERIRGAQDFGGIAVLGSRHGKELHNSAP